MQGDSPSTESQPSRWLAYELHDGLLQWVVGARLQLTAVLNRLGEQSEGADVLRGALKSLDTALVEGRNLIAYLEQDLPQTEPSLVDELSKFVERVRPEVELREQQIYSHIDLGAGRVRLDNTLCWNLLRIAQQAVQNAIHHAGPTRIEVSLHANADQLTLSVTDQGCGFDDSSPQTDKNRFGLKSMFHRAKLIGARLELQSTMGRGTKIVCVLDLPS